MRYIVIFAYLIFTIGINCRPTGLKSHIQHSSFKSSNHHPMSNKVHPDTSHHVQA
jgi:hypothetical protein